MCLRRQLRSTLLLGELLAASLRLSATITSGPPDDYLTPFGVGLDGVTSLEIVRSTSSVGCTGVLLSTGRHVLTAAHCVADSAGNPDVYGLTALFETPGTFAQIEYSSVVLYPAYQGDPIAGNDLAIIILAGLAPSGADRYSIYRGSDEVGQTGLMVGYGATGQGKEDDTFPQAGGGAVLIGLTPMARHFIFKVRNRCCFMTSITVCLEMTDSGLPSAGMIWARVCAKCFQLTAIPVGRHF